MNQPWINDDALIADGPAISLGIRYWATIIVVTCRRWSIPCYCPLVLYSPCTWTWSCFSELVGANLVVKNKKKRNFGILRAQGETLIGE